MLKGIANAFRIPELRNKILFTLAILLLYRFGAYLPAPGVPFSRMLEAFQTASAGSGAIAIRVSDRVDKSPVTAHRKTCDEGIFSGG